MRASGRWRRGVNTTGLRPAQALIGCDLVHCRLYYLRHPQLHRSPRGYRDRLTGPRIAPHRCRPVSYREIAEAIDAHFAALCQLVNNGLKHDPDDVFRQALTDRGPLRDFPSDVAGVDGDGGVHDVSSMSFKSPPFPKAPVGSGVSVTVTPSASRTRRSASRSSCRGPQTA